MQSPIITKLSEADNFGEDIVEICKKRIERYENLKATEPKPKHEYYEARIYANKEKIKRIQNVQRMFNSQCS